MPNQADVARAYLDRLVALYQQKEEIQQDICDLLAEAQSRNVDARALRALAAEMTQPERVRARKRALEQALNELRALLGDYIETPLGAAAVGAIARAPAGQALNA